MLDPSLQQLPAGIFHQPSPLPATVFASSSASSGELYSGLLLAASVRCGERDHVLRLHELLSSPRALALNLPALLGWSSMVHMYLLFLSELMLPAHWQTWMAAGLTLEQTESRTMCTSPIDMWSKRAKRPLRTESVQRRSEPARQSDTHAVNPESACM